MQTITINQENAARAAEFLVLLDSSAIMEIHRRNANRYLETLKQALNSYHLLMQKYYLVMFSRQTRLRLLQKNLDSLLRYTICLSCILIPEAQRKLADYLSDPMAPRPYVEMLFSNEMSVALVEQG